MPSNTLNATQKSTMHIKLSYSVDITTYQNFKTKNKSYNVNNISNSALNK